jgi:2-keto-4-pentenoate hydratase/2-oxohepta-3-ene-1,7-dioic acid hydratase in catechol pathway
MLDEAGKLRDLSGVVPDIAGAALSPESLKKLLQLDASTLPVVDGPYRVGPCVGAVGKFICIGLNYSDHAAESGMAVPKEPVVFMKATSSIIGPDDDVMIPKDSMKTDWEVELGVVIGKEARYVEESEALSYVAGYCVVNDLSERAFQLEGTGQWVKGKSADTFGPIGPWLVTTDEIPDPQSLRLWLEVDGHKFQDGTTATMVFGVAHLVSYLSRYMSLQPGDIISTGTPPGVGLGQKPPVYLKAGNKIKLGIDGLGEQTQNVIAYSPQILQAASPKVNDDTSPELNVVLHVRRAIGKLGPHPVCLHHAKRDAWRDVQIDSAAGLEAERAGRRRRSGSSGEDAVGGMGFAEEHVPKNRGVVVVRTRRRDPLVLRASREGVEPQPDAGGADLPTL